MKDNVEELPESYPDSRNVTTTLEDVPRLTYEFIEQYPKDEDNNELITKYFPFIISPTENDWQHSPLNRVLKPGAARVRVTSKNAKPIEYKITILDKPDNDKIVKVEERIT